MSRSEKIKRHRERIKPRSYVYQDEDGDALYRVVRRGKEFKHEKADGVGGWKTGKGVMKNVLRIPYRLPEFMKKKRVYIVEGEKDADALWEMGFAATTNPGGAGKWLEEFNEYFNDKHVRVIPDNDTPGQSHALNIAENLLPVAKSVKIIRLDVAKEGGDFSDWKAAGGTRDQLIEIAKQTKRLTKAELQESKGKLAKSPEVLLFDKGRRLTQKGIDKHDALTDLLKIWRDDQKFDLSDQKVDEIAASAIANKPPWHIGDLFRDAGFDSLSKKPPIDEVRECLKSLGRSLFEINDSECTTWCRQEFNRRSRSYLDIRGPDRLFDQILESLRFEVDVKEISSIQQSWASIKPWEKAVELEELLDDMVKLLEQYFILPSKSVVHFLAVWAVGSFVYDLFYVFPYIAIHSPEGGCGKTNLLNTMGSLSSRAKKAGSITASSLFRYAHALHPTFLMDELSKNKLRQNEEMRTIINLGHNRDGIKTVSESGPGGGYVPVDYNVFCPKVMAGVGDYLAAVDDTTNTRSIHIEMKKALPEEATGLLDWELLIKGTTDLVVKKKSLPLYRKALRWTNDHKEDLLRADEPKYPKGIINRDKTNWRPLLKITEMGKGKWPKRGRIAARKLCGVPETQRDDERQMLLKDLNVILKEHPEEEKGFWTRELIGILDQPGGYLSDEKFAHHPWQNYRGGRPINAKQLATLLKQDIMPRNLGKQDVEGDMVNLNGYYRKDLEVVIERSLTRARNPKKNQK